MVPTFIMPPVMQSLSALSPMAWGLAGFLDIIVYNVEWSDVLENVLKLWSFAAVCLGVALYGLKRKMKGEE